MVQTDISAARASDMENAVEDVEIEIRSTEGIGSQDETEWINSDFPKWFSYYKKIPEVKIATDTMSSWVIGDGFTADPETTVILDHIFGWGTDTFDDILENQDKMSRINGDSFAQVMRDDESDESAALINLKPLDPSSIKIIVDKKGVIKRYEQINKLSKKNETIHKFEPDEIFHLSNKRIADEIHGVSDYEAIEEIILALNESFFDMKKVMHYFVKPKLMVELDEDDPVKIEAFIAKFDDATNKGENLFYPKGAVSTPQVLAVPPNSTLNPLPWREDLKNYFYQVVGLPQILMGGAAEFSESSAKIAYLSFEQVVKQRQRYIIMQVWNQLGLKIDLAFPTSLKNELLSDEQKDMNATTGSVQGTEFQPADTTAGVGK